MVEVCAWGVHEANRALCQANGDNSQVPWEQTSEENRNTSREGVRRILANPLMTAADIHQEWVNGKAADGWKHGPKKDADAKTHPSMVPFDQLPKIEQDKDRLFQVVVQQGALAYLSSQAGRVATRFATIIRRPPRV